MALCVIWSVSYTHLDVYMRQVFQHRVLDELTGIQTVLHALDHGLVDLALTHDENGVHGGDSDTDTNVSG